MNTAECPVPRRLSGLLLPEDPGEEELARNWTLSEADKREALQCRGDENRRRFALQLCVLRRHGRLLEIGETAPVRIVNHLGAQLELPPVLFTAGALRPVTEKQYADRVRRYLGWRGFDAKTQHELAVWVEQRTLEGFSLAEVALLAAELLELASGAAACGGVRSPGAVALPACRKAGLCRDRRATAARFPKGY